MIRSVCFAVAGAFCFAGALAAQPLSLASAQLQTPAHSFEDLRLQLAAGDTVYVIDTADLATRGRLAAISDVSLMLTVDGTRQEFAAGAVRQIDRRRRDSIRNGLLIGLGTGALLGFSLGRATDSPSCPRAGIECGQGALIGTVGGAVWGAVGGWITDALIRKREVVYLAERRAPAF